MTEESYTLITGASQGIGECLADSFAQRGCNLIITARSQANLEAVARALRTKHGVKVEIITQDLSQPGSSLELFNKIFAENFSVNGIVNNAGFGYLGEFVDTPANQVTGMAQVNMTSLTELCHLFLNQNKSIEKKWILNVASVAAFVPGPMMSQYYASKAYVLSFTEALREELKSQGVKVSSLCPGPTATGFGKRAKVGDALLFKILPQLTAAQNAELGYLGLMKNKSIVIPGFFNWLIAKLNNWTPRAIAKPLLKKIHSGL